jgi:hypothetical protein
MTMPAAGRLTHRAKRAEQRYAGRSKNAVPTTLSLDVEAKRLLRDMTTGGTMGAFVSGLIRAEAARREERQRLWRLLADENTAGGGTAAV